MKREFKLQIGTGCMEGFVRIVEGRREIKIVEGGVVRARAYVANVFPDAVIVKESKARNLCDR